MKKNREIRYKVGLFNINEAVMKAFGSEFVSKKLSKKYNVPKIGLVRRDHMDIMHGKQIIKNFKFAKEAFFVCYKELSNIEKINRTSPLALCFEVEVRKVFFLRVKKHII